MSFSFSEVNHECPGVAARDQILFGPVFATLKQDPGKALIEWRLENEDENILISDLSHCPYCGDRLPGCITNPPIEPQPMPTSLPPKKDV